MWYCTSPPISSKEKDNLASRTASSNGVSRECAAGHMFRERRQFERLQGAWADTARCLGEWNDKQPSSRSVDIVVSVSFPEGITTHKHELGLFFILTLKVPTPTVHFLHLHYCWRNSETIGVYRWRLSTWWSAISGVKRSIHCSEDDDF